MTDADESQLIDHESTIEPKRAWEFSMCPDCEGHILVDRYDGADRDWICYRYETTFDKRRFG